MTADEGVPCHEHIDGSLQVLAQVRHGRSRNRLSGLESVQAIFESAIFLIKIEAIWHDDAELARQLFLFSTWRADGVNGLALIDLGGNFLTAREGIGGGKSVLSYRRRIPGTGL